ncbi:MAG: aminoacyl-histidine dipeptidase [Taibaiella sp.]|nr:aminoacyl-histidine dipeptidase [Taibaiella sp.]
MSENSQIRALQPSALWNHFTDLNAVPRPSKKEERVIAFIKDFGERLGLSTATDSAGNVIIKKPASPGMENRKTVVLQSHLDMVHQKNSDTNFDFDTQGIEMYVDGDWVRAKGTTLGADNGIGVAAIMSLLSSTDIPHPPIEALFTIDEETGMTGAFALKGGFLAGDILLNLDTEADNELTIGCAGGLDITATGTYAQRSPNGSAGLQISVKGLTGGHSGGDIHLGRGNANKIMNRLLTVLDRELVVEIASVTGGSLRNAIPRESVANIAVKDAAKVTKRVSELAADIMDEYAITDPQLSITCTTIDVPSAVASHEFQEKMLRALYACPNGIYRMSPSIGGLVQSSNNLAKVSIQNGSFNFQCLTRSSVDSEKYDVANAISSSFELMNADVTQGNAYPGWQPQPDSAIVRLMSSLYKEMFNEDAHVNAVHAGLECGILGTNYPGMQMISFGPNITGAHSPDERVQISSVQKFWKYLLETLNRIPTRA